MYILYNCFFNTNHCHDPRFRTFKQLEIFEGQCFSDIYVLLIYLERSHVL
jgi:hypothetical protein